MQRTLASFVLVLLLTPASLAAAPENDPHYLPVKAVGNLAFMVHAPQGTGVIRYFGTGSLDEGSRTAVRAIVNISGLLRNSDVYERTGEKAIEAARANSDTILITPQFLAQVDVTGHTLPADTLRWEVQTWLDGTPALAPAPLSAFDVLDAIVQRLNDANAFPALQEILLLGHSAGGQLVQRYAVVGKAPDTSRLGVRFVVANPSSYVYFDRKRPAAKGKFEPYPAAQCPKYNNWKYGFEGVPPYVDGRAEDYERRYVHRRVTYLLGMLDTDPHHPVLDRSCGAEAEGAYRLIRGENYVHYLQQRHPEGTNQDLAEVPKVDHDGDAMFTSPCGVEVIFVRYRGDCQHTQKV